MRIPTVLQLCHGYDAPFHTVALRYESLFKGTPFRVVTVFLKGTYNKLVADSFQSGPVIFLDQTSKDIRGLKRSQIALIRQLHQRYHFRLCVAHRYKSIYIALHLKHVPVIGVHHIDSVYRRWTRRVYIRRHSDRLVLFGVSQAIQRDILDSLKSYPVERTGYLYNSLDFDGMRSEFLERSQAREFLRIPHDAFVFGTVGRIHPDKDPATMIHAFALASRDMPSSRLVMIGEGRLEAEIKALIRERNLTDKVILAGRLERAYRYLKAFDAFVLSSIREGLPVALLEAFTAGLVCAVTRCNGNAEAIDGVGFGYEVGDHNRLSEIMREIFHMDKDERDSLLERVEEKLQNIFSPSAVHEAFWKHPYIRPILNEASSGSEPVVV